MTKLFNKCPACGGRITLTECRCSRCDLQLRGDFELGPFARLSDDQLAFVKVFLSVRGNLSEVERVLGISYPTIRNKLDEINSALAQTDHASSEKGQADQPAGQKLPPAAGDERRAVLQKVASGQLSPGEALSKLQQLQGEK
jgi:hypothetical protein